MMLPHSQSIIINEYSGSNPQVGDPENKQNQEDVIEDPPIKRFFKLLSLLNYPECRNMIGKSGSILAELALYGLAKGVPQYQEIREVIE